MEKALFPLKYMAETQSVNGSFSHVGSFAIDYGHQGTKEKVYAPFTGVIRKIAPDIGNAIWFESVDKVLFANGIIDYMTILFMHDDDVSDLKVGKVIKQGEHFYNQGTAGWATGVHLHLEVGRGKFRDRGWYYNSDGTFMINDAIHPALALFLTEDIIIKRDGGYNWRKVIGKPINRNLSNNQIEVLVDDLHCRKNFNGDILGFVNRGIYDILEISEQEDYKWIKIANNKWIAHSDEWSKLYLIKEKDINEKIKILEEENKLLKKEIQKLNIPIKFSYVCLETGKHIIKLNKNEVIYIKDD